MHRIWSALRRRSIMLGLAFAMVAITAIGVGGIVASVIVAERIQGSGSAINVAGSLRKQTHRMGSQVLADTANGASSHGALQVAMNQFEASLADPSLRAAMARAPRSDFAQTYAKVLGSWHDQLKPMLAEEALPGEDAHPVERHNELLAVIDAFVDTINTMVAQLEKDTETKISRMRAILGAALFLILAVLLGSLYVVHHIVLAPLKKLVDNTKRYAKGDFSARFDAARADELGQLGEAYNTMAEELSKLYRGLEQRVAEKTAALTRSNQSLELLYNAISRLHKSPEAPDTYQAVLKDLEVVLGLSGSLACLRSNYGGHAVLLASSLGDCPNQVSGHCESCMEGLANLERWHYETTERGDTLVVPLRDNEGLYGVLRLAMLPGKRLEPWQEQLLEALSRHIGVALGISHKTEQERLLALQEERSVIARELHDSIAQSLSYMKIQASLLHPVLSDPAHREQAEATLANLRDGITSAYRQLRELLATFRLKMRGDFLELLSRTVIEFSDRGGLPIQLDTRMEGCRLSPNQEIHALQIIREALSNVLRHAQANQAWVHVAHEAGEVRIAVEDDGIGLPPPPYPEGLHYGMNIMRERAEGLHGELLAENRLEGGTRILLRFSPTIPLVPTEARAATLLPLELQ